MNIPAERTLKPYSFIFRPLFVLFISLVGASLYALYASLRFTGDKLSNQYYYVVPIVIPFIAFLLDRAEDFRRKEMRIKLICDALVMLTAMWRVIGDVPYVSGHALFLTYAVLSSRSRVARLTAAVVMAEVIYLKFLFWHDWLTPTSGILIGTVMAFVRSRYGAAGQPKAVPDDLTTS